MEYSYNISMHSYESSLLLLFSLILSHYFKGENFYIILIDVGSIPQQNLHNIYFSIGSCSV